LFAYSRNIGVLRIEWFAEGDRHVIRNSFRQFGEEASALEREDRAPKLIEPNWNDRCVRVTHDQFVATLQTQQRPGAFELAFGKKTDDFAGGDLFGGDPNS